MSIFPSKLKMLPSPPPSCPPLTPNIGPFHHRCKHHAAIVSTVHSGSLNREPFKEKKEGHPRSWGKPDTPPIISPVPWARVLSGEATEPPANISVGPQIPTVAVMGWTLHPSQSKGERRFSPRLRATRMCIQLANSPHREMFIPGSFSWAVFVERGSPVALYWRFQQVWDRSSGV